MPTVVQVHQVELLPAFQGDKHRRWTFICNLPESKVTEKYSLCIKENQSMHVTTPHQKEIVISPYLLRRSVLHLNIEEMEV